MLWSGYLMFLVGHGGSELGLFVMGVVPGFWAGGGIYDEPESLILAQSERWRHA